MVTGKCADIGKFKGPILGGQRGERRTSTTGRQRHCWIRWTSTTRDSAWISRSGTKTIWWRF